MYQDTIDRFAALARAKADLLRDSPLAFAVGSLMAGAYVGVGIILIFSVGGALDPAWQKFVMGVSFGVALTLVVFAGSELFTGHTMYMAFGLLKGLTGWGTWPGSGPRPGPSTSPERSASPCCSPRAAARRRPTARRCCTRSRTPR